MEQTTPQDESVATLPSTSAIEEGHLSDELGESVTRYVVVDINHNLYGMSTESTVELMSGAMTQVTRVPHSPKYITGVINHRGTIIPVIDMRSLFGFEVRGAEVKKLASMFETLKSDHTQWLSALHESVSSSTPFTKSIDPTMCNFGKWYATALDGSTPLRDLTENDPILKSLVDRLDTPHRKIHSIAEEVLQMKENGEVEQAIACINSAEETDLAEMCGIFDQISKSVASKLESMLVITEVGSRKAAIAVDGVSFVVDCDNDRIETLPDTADNTEFLSGLVHQSDGTYILIADFEHIYNIACPEE